MRPVTSSWTHGCSQQAAKASVTLDVPFPAHRFASGFAIFDIEQNPCPPAGRFGAATRVMLPEASVYVSRPANIGSAIIFALASEHIDEEDHFSFRMWFGRIRYFRSSRNL
jgi:hypothetical protein